MKYLLAILTSLVAQPLAAQQVNCDPRVSWCHGGGSITPYQTNPYGYGCKPTISDGQRRTLNCGESQNEIVRDRGRRHFRRDDL